MNTVSLTLVLIIMALVSAAQNGQPDSENNQVKQLVCDAVAKQLRESTTNGVALRMTIDDRGRVESFTTESPKGLRLEKVKEVAAAIKGMQFKPAIKEGSPVRVQIRTEFDCTSQRAKEKWPHAQGTPVVFAPRGLALRNFAHSVGRGATVRFTKSVRRPVQSGFAEIFTKTLQVCSQPATASDKNIQSNRALADITELCDQKTAPTPLHRPVNWLHFIEKPPHT